MKDPHLLEATGSEPLSLHEEIAMQQSWRDDPDKCTFIVLSRDGCCCDETIDSDFVCRNLQAMVGDVNLFISEEEEDDDDDDDEDTNEKCPQQAELDIMIAENAYQRLGIGREASCLMMMYGAKYLGIRRYFCKINEDNTGSRALFERLGFHQCHYAECFRQVELELKRSTPQEMEQAITDLCGGGTMTTFNCPLRQENEQTTS
jgi:RimJ/RimL family protein N-acetyltransferase